MVHYLSTYKNLRVYGEMGRNMEIEDLRIPVKLKEQYKKILLARENQDDSDASFEADEIEQETTSGEFILALKMRKVLGSQYSVQFRDKTVTYPFKFRLMADYGTALTWSETEGHIGGIESVSWLVYPPQIKDKLKEWYHIFSTNMRTENPDWEEFNSMGLEVAKMIKAYFADLIEIKYRIFDASAGFTVTDWEIVE